MHIGRTYESLIPVKERYKNKMVKLPKPEFYVFYNGKDKIEPESVLKLSDAYIKDDISGQKTEEKNTDNTQNALDRKEESSLELIVKVIDINADSKAELLKKCPVLNEYAQFVSRVRHYKDLGMEDAMERAIKECIEEDILRDYLSRRGSEVINMLCAEYDYDMDMAVKREEAYEDGFSDGFSGGFSDGLSKGADDERKKIAKNFLNQEVEESIIISATGLSVEELEKLK